MSDDTLPSWSELLALVEQLEATDFEDFVVEMPGLTVRVSRRGLLDAAAVAEAADIPGAAIPAEQVERPAGVEITAPIVGLFYRGPAPEQPPFVEVGDVVAAGATTGIIEVMKMMVPVEATVAGRIVAVLAENGDMVEDGQPLFIVDTSGIT